MRLSRVFRVVFMLIVIAVTVAFLLNQQAQQQIATEVQQAVDATAMIHQLFDYPTGGHNIEGKNFGTAMQRTVEFYQTHL